MKMKTRGGFLVFPTYSSNRAGVIDRFGPLWIFRIFCCDAASNSVSIW